MEVDEGYVKWLKYWLLFALLLLAETFTDVLLSSSIPYYYEIKAGLVLWLLSSHTKGSWTVYKKFVRPLFHRHEKEIDKIITTEHKLRFHNTLNLCTKLSKYAATAVTKISLKITETN